MYLFFAGYKNVRQDEEIDTEEIAKFYFRTSLYTTAKVLEKRRPLKRPGTTTSSSGGGGGGCRDSCNASSFVICLKNYTFSFYFTFRKEWDAHTVCGSGPYLFQPNLF